MKACWNELFALGMAQCSSVMNVGNILSAIITHLQTSLQEGRRELTCLNMTRGQKKARPLNFCHSDHVFCRQAVTRASKTSNGAHLEDAGVL